MTTAFILGSAFDVTSFSGVTLEPLQVETEFGVAQIHRYRRANGGEGWVLFRHGLPHRLLPHQINFRANTRALQSLGCSAVVVTSSVGVLDAELPLDQPMLVSDLLMPDNRLPDGTACTMFTEPTDDQAHLVLDEGLFSPALGEQLEEIGASLGLSTFPRVLFAYSMGPRTKTPAENVFWARLGAQVNSMTLAPEVILANELGMVTAGLVVGHKYSVAGIHDRLDREGTTHSLRRSADVLGPLIRTALDEIEPSVFGNTLYRFSR